MSKIKQLISVDCEKSPKREVCGFVVFEDDEYKILPAENKSPNKENEFYIPAKDFLYVKNTKNVVAIYPHMLKEILNPPSLIRKLAI